MAEQTIIKLHNGHSHLMPHNKHDHHLMPQLGFGLWQISNKDAIKAVTTALEIGYRSIDTAAIYGNEEGVGQALKSTSIPRNHLFITTKLWNTDHKNAEAALRKSLKKLQLDYVDLYLIHWPCPKQNQYIDAWKSLITLQKKGLAKNIGVCNFHTEHLQHLIDETGIAPAVNQIELHPLLQQHQLHAWNATHNIATESWSPLAQGKHQLFSEPSILKLATSYGKTPAQIVIRWHLDRGLIVIPKSISSIRLKENFDVFDFKLDKEEIAQIAKLDLGKRLGPDPNIFNDLTPIN